MEPTVGQPDTRAIRFKRMVSVSRIDRRNKLARRARATVYSARPESVLTRFEAAEISDFRTGTSSRAGAADYPSAALEGRRAP